MQHRSINVERAPLQRIVVMLNDSSPNLASTEYFHQIFGCLCLWNNTMLNSHVVISNVVIHQIFKNICLMSWHHQNGKRKSLGWDADFAGFMGDFLNSSVLWRLDSYWVHRSAPLITVFNPFKMCVSVSARLSVCLSVSVVCVWLWPTSILDGLFIHRLLLRRLQRLNTGRLDCGDCTPYQWRSISSEKNSSNFFGMTLC